ncbi:hypothetical protein VIBNISOn1_1610015 [Vibrio nigripulchritudo SOn1]|uniref:Transposase n=1 Tax=Vibrio nigripulchritudo SOn1 TaxID=1238450 RepID=A0AAV2VMY1_9VIBR|nr:hypothetical protein VIBNISOn1_1610015 [Vibrio nigripulchritudo SOn1]
MCGIRSIFSHIESPFQFLDLLVFSMLNCYLPEHGYLPIHAQDKLDRYI